VKVIFKLHDKLRQDSYRRTSLQWLQCVWMGGRDKFKMLLYLHPLHTPPPPPCHSPTLVPCQYQPPPHPTPTPPHPTLPPLHPTLPPLHPTLPLLTPTTPHSHHHHHHSHHLAIPYNDEWLEGSWLEMRNISVF